MMVRLSGFVLNMWLCIALVLYFTSVSRLNAVSAQKVEEVKGPKDDKGEKSDDKGKSTKDNREEAETRENKETPPTLPTLPITSLGDNAPFHDPNFTPLPNMVAGCRGYNILAANPFKDLGDPGFVGQIFVPAEFDAKYGRMALVSGITANDLSSCETSLTSNSITNLEGLLNFTEKNTASGLDLQVGVDVEVTTEAGLPKILPNVAPDLKAEASATIPPVFQQAWGKSREVQKMAERFVSEETLTSVASSSCEQYEMIIDRKMPPPFTDMFKEGIVELSAKKDAIKDAEKQKAFREFIEDYGSHYMLEVKLGAKQTVITEYSKLARDTMSLDKLNSCSFKKGEKVFGVQFKEDENRCTNEDIQKIENMGKENNKVTITSKGSRPTDTEDWASQEFYPVPLRFKLAPIINLFRKSFLKVNEVMNAEEKQIVPGDLKWFEDIYVNQEKFCAAMGIECAKKTENICGYNDHCPPDTFCDRSAKEKQTCSAWTQWRCAADCGRGRLESRTRQCNGCIGKTYDEIEKSCKAEKGCYISKLRIPEKAKWLPPKIPFTVLPGTLRQKMSVCLLYKSAHPPSTDSMGLFSLVENENGQNSGKVKTIMRLSLTTKHLLAVELFDAYHQDDIKFQGFRDNQLWHHVCLVWRHQWSLFGEISLYLDGLFFETIPVTLKTSVAAADHSGSLIIGGQSNDEGEISSHNTFIGDISGLYIYNRILTTTDIEDAFNGYAPTEGEVFSWHLPEPRPGLGYESFQIIKEAISPVDVIAASEEGELYMDRDPMQYHKAMTECETHSGLLATIDSPTDNEKMVKKMSRLGMSKFWVGLTTHDKGTTWMWSDGRQLENEHWANWNSQATSQVDGPQRCVIVESNGKWHPKPCTDRFGFVCLINEVLIDLKNADQSSTSFQNSANLAIDKRFDTNSVTRVSDTAPHNWWKAELDKKVTITKVHVTADEYRRYVGFKISTSEDGETWVLCGDPGRKLAKEMYEVKCNAPVAGMYIKVELSGNEKKLEEEMSLALKEVQVYGRFPRDFVKFVNPRRGYEKGQVYIEGYVEIKHHGTYGTICDTDFNDKNAKVICAMMGDFVDGKYNENFKQEKLAAKRNRKVWLDNLDCDGTENSVSECGHQNWGDHDCRSGSRPHMYDVGVRCYKAKTTEIKIDNIVTAEDAEGRRYVQGPVAFKGEKSEWGFMCPSFYDASAEDIEYGRRKSTAKKYGGKSLDEQKARVKEVEVKVLCKSMGYKSGTHEKLRKEDKWTTENPNKNAFDLVAGLKCPPSSLLLDDCTIIWEEPKPWYRRKCAATNVATVIRCYF